MKTLGHHKLLLQLSDVTGRQTPGLSIPQPSLQCLCIQVGVVYKQAGVRGIIFRVNVQQLCHAETQKRSHTGKRYIVVLLVHYEGSVRTALVRMQTQVVYSLALKPVTGAMLGVRWSQTQHVAHWSQYM